MNLQEARAKYRFDNNIGYRYKGVMFAVKRIIPPVDDLDGYGIDAICVVDDHLKLAMRIPRWDDNFLIIPRVTTTVEEEMSSLMELFRAAIEEGNERFKDWPR